MKLTMKWIRYNTLKIRKTKVADRKTLSSKMT